MIYFRMLEMCVNIYCQIVLVDGNAVHMFHQCQNFKLYNLQEKPSSYVVLNGGWAIYEKPGFKVQKHLVELNQAFMTWILLGKTAVSCRWRLFLQ